MNINELKTLVKENPHVYFSKEDIFGIYATDRLISVKDYLNLFNVEVGDVFSDDDVAILFTNQGRNIFYGTEIAISDEMIKKSIDISCHNAIKSILNNRYQLQMLVMPDSTAFILPIVYDTSLYSYISVFETKKQIAKRIPPKVFVNVDGITSPVPLDFDKTKIKNSLILTYDNVLHNINEKIQAISKNKEQSELLEKFYSYCDIKNKF